MDKIHLLFPIALLAFIVIVFGAFAASRSISPSTVSDGREKRFGKRDSLIILIITACYALTAFLNLGTTESPESFCRFGERGQYALIELKEPEGISAISYFTGIHTGNYYVQFSEDGENFTDVGILEQGYADLLKWKRLDTMEYAGSTRYVRLIADDEIWLGEIALYDLDGIEIGTEKLIIPDGCIPLFDERETVPDKSTYLNSSYFDEIYHVRTAYEHLEAVSIRIKVGC